MMRKLFKRKVAELNDDKLQALLKLRYDTNREVIDLAIEEARKRGLELPEVSISLSQNVNEREDIKKLERWNWGAFLLAPFWALSNKLEKWMILTCIPGVNLIAMIYLGAYGNKLAYNKSNIKNIDQFMILQRRWSKAGIRIFMLGIAASIIWLFTSGE